MGCTSCRVDDLKFEIKIEGETNLHILPNVIEHLGRREITVKVENNILIIKESGVKEFLDFCIDHMNFENVSFRLPDQEWRAIREVEQILEVQWIDEIIEKELITCFFQPIVNVKKEIYAYEILSRFKKEDGSTMYPNEVFSAAKSRGRLYALDRICRMTAVRNAVLLKNVKTFINFIPTSIYSPEFCLRSTTKLANELGVDSSQLVFEVVETEKVDDIDHLKKILAYYKDKGFQYALDDVGEGYNTIELLADIKPNYMKLDMKFVQGVADDVSKQETAKKLIDMALEIGSVPLAEGVETQEDFDWMKECGYELFQGYFFGKPAPSPIERVEQTQ